MKFRADEFQLAKSSHDPDAYAAGAVNGAGIDTLGFSEALFVVQAGTLGTNATLDFKLQQSSDNGSSDAYADISGAAIVQLTQAGTDESDSVAVIRVNLNGNYERYLRGVLTVGTATSDAGALCILSSPDKAPVSQEITPINVGG